MLWSLGRKEYNIGVQRLVCVRVCVCVGGGKWIAIFMRVHPPKL